MVDFYVEAEIRGDFVTNTYVYLYKTAKNAFARAKESEEGQLYNLMTTFVFLAFCFEAYLNHVAEKRIDEWDKKERKASQEKRRNAVLTKIGIAPDYQSRPFETLDKLFWFRDTLAHARTETVTKSGHKERVNWTNPDAQELMRTEWQKYCTLENAEVALNDIEEIVQVMGCTCGENDPLRSLGRGSISLKQVDTDF